MASLTPGALLRLIDEMGSRNTKNPESPSLSALLQVIGIVPALAGSDLWPNQGFYLKVSDSSHAAYATLAEEDDELILSDSLQLGQFISVDRLEHATPVPILRGVRTLPGRHKCVGEPEDVISTLPGTTDATITIGNGRSDFFPRKNSSGSEASSIDSGGGGGRFTKKFSVVENFAAKLSQRLSQKPLEMDSSGDSGLSEIERQQQQLRILEENAAARGRTTKGRPVKSRVYDSISAPSTRSMSASPMRRGTPTSDKEAPRSRRRVSDVPNLVSPRSRQPSPAAKRSSSTGKNRVVEPARRKSASGARLGDLVAASSRTIRKSWEGAFAPKETRSGSKTTKPKPDLKISIPIVSTKPTSDKVQVSPRPDSTKKSNAKVLEQVKKSIDGALLWEALPSGLVTLGKDTIQRREAASQAAAEALQEASMAEAVIRNLSKFAELRAGSKSDFPQPTVEKFLSLHQSLEQATAVSDALTTSKTATDEAKAGFAGAIHAEKAKNAKMWVDSALSCDLSAFTMQNKVALGKIKAAPMIILEGPRSISAPTPMKSHTPALSPRTALSSVMTPVAPRRTCEEPSAKASSPFKMANALVRRNLSGVSKPASSRAQAEQGAGLSKMKETAELAKMMQAEARSWFLKFMEEALDKGFQAGLNGRDEDSVSGNNRPRSSIYNGQLAAMLSQLKRVNDWLDQVGSEKEDVPDMQLVETLARLKRKIYEFLIKHVESAASALGCSRSSSLVVS